tara:strand:+ start:24917 stop:25132 length:216 start_codon:yes stop_codon:yes gene_type:complete
MEFPIYYDILDTLGYMHWFVGFIFIGGLLTLAFLIGAQYGHKVASDALDTWEEEQEELTSIQRMLDQQKAS